MRILYKDEFKEIHVKIFNTGKLEIPGIQNDELFEMVLDLLLKLLKNILKDNTLAYNMASNETVLINSNFNCGFYINRETLFHILRFKYKINSCYDPCSYPGIQSKFYYDKRLEKNDGRQPVLIDENIFKISFMIFRTGSVLIVGKCEEYVLRKIYEFVKNMLQSEFHQIATKIDDERPPKSTKIKKKLLYIYKTKT